MAKCFIGLGKCSKKYLYILGTIFFNIIKDCFFGFAAIDPESKIGLFGFSPELSRHFLIQDFYKYLSFILGGLLFMYILKKESTKEDEISQNSNKRNSNKSLILKGTKKGLIQNKKNDIFKKTPIFQVIIICFIFYFHSEFSRIMYLFDFGGLDFWIFDFIFILFFMDTYFILNYYKHQKIYAIFILVINSILLIISSFLKNINNESSELKNKNSYEIVKYITGSDYFFLLVILIFIFLSAILSFRRVKTKVLMHFNYVSPYKILCYIGIIGCIITLIAFIFVSIFDCKVRENVSNYCILTITDDNNNTKYYYDNINIYFSELYKNISNFKFYFEIFLITPLFLVINFLGFTCEILTLYYLNPLFLLVRENLYFCIQKFTFIVVNLDNFNDYITLQQLLILQSSEIIALLGYSVYLEIIELRFCGLDKDVKRKIIERAKKESIHTKYIDNNDEGNNEDNNDDNENNENSFIDENNNSDQ